MDRPEYISEQDWNDLLEHRRGKKAKNSERALRILAQQLWKAKGMGWEISEVVDYIIIRNWMGFMADWLPAKQTQREVNPYREKLRQIEAGHGDRD